MSQTEPKRKRALTGPVRCGVAMCFVLSSMLGAAVAANAQEDAPAEPPPAEPPPAEAREPAPCVAPTFRAQLMTSTAGRIPRDMGVVVGLVPGGTVSAVPPLSLTRRRRSIATRTEPLAPGLVRVIPDARRVAGRYTLSGVAGEPELLFARAAVPPPPTRPSLERLERYVVSNVNGSHTELKAHFGFPIPQGVVAVLVYLGDATAPSFFAPAVPTRTEAVLHASALCPNLPEGSTPPPSSGSLRVAFVDLYGHVSQISDPQSY
ncbi:MAG: hypothetical protein AB8I08_15025 [Sandaracinaceae bacterium]